MAEKLSVALVTPSRQVATVAVDRVVAPSVMGQLTVLPMHAPLLADLAPGVVELQAANRADQYFVSGGFIEVENDRVVLLAETAEDVSTIDVSRARSDLQESESRLKSMDSNSAEYPEEQRRAERARQRLQAARPSE